MPTGGNPGRHLASYVEASYLASLPAGVRVHPRCNKAPLLRRGRWVGTGRPPPAGAESGAHGVYIERPESYTDLTQLVLEIKARTNAGRLQERTAESMIKVKSRGNESLDQMLRRFKKMCEKEGLTKEIKRTSYYEKPSERRRRRMRKTQKREMKAPAPRR